MFFPFFKISNPLRSFSRCKKKISITSQVIKKLWQQFVFIFNDYGFEANKMIKKYLDIFEYSLKISEFV